MVFGGVILVCISIFDFIRMDSRAQSPASTPSEEAALRAVVESYSAASDKEDMAGVVALWSEKSPNLAAYRQSLQQQFASEDLSYGSPSVSLVKVENEDLETETMAAALLLGGLRPPGRVEIAMSASK
jgi:hypothetical protein